MKELLSTGVGNRGMKIPEVLESVNALIGEIVEIEGILTAKGEQIYLAPEETTESGLREGILVRHSFETISDMINLKRIIRMESSLDLNRSPIQVKLVATLKSTGDTPKVLSLDTITELGVELDSCYYEVQIMWGDNQLPFGTLPVRAKTLFTITIKSDTSPPESVKQLELLELEDSLELYIGQAICVQGYLCHYNRSAFCVTPIPRTAADFSPSVFEKSILIEVPTISKGIRDVISPRIPIPYSQEIEVVGIVERSKTRPFFATLTDVFSIIIKDTSYIPYRQPKGI